MSSSRVALLRVDKAGGCTKSQAGGGDRIGKGVCGEAAETCEWPRLWTARIDGDGGVNGLSI
jgi:hypothetical protein